MDRYNLILSGAATCFVGFVLSYFGDWIQFQGPLLTFGFILTAIGIRSRESLKSYSYPLFIFAAISASMYYPNYFTGYGGFKSKILIVPLLQIIMFGMGSQMSLKDFSGIIKQPLGVLVGVVCQFTIMPFIAVMITYVFDFPAEIAAGIILIGASPSGLASNVMSFIAKANIALSVTLTIVATLLAPFLTPLLMKLLAGQMIPIDFLKMTNGIIDMIILPIIAGFIFNAFAYDKISIKNKLLQTLFFLGLMVIKNVLLFDNSDIEQNSLYSQFLTDGLWFVLLPIALAWIFKRFANGNKEILDKILLIISMGGIALIICIITATGRDSLLEVGLLLLLASLMHNFSGYFLGYWICRLLKMDEKSCRTIALEVGMQNGGLASGIAVQMGKVATVGLAPAVFGPLMNITGSSLAIWWRDKKIITQKNKK